MMMMILFSCITKNNKPYSTINYKDGTISLDSYGKGLFIPNNEFRKDNVRLTYTIDNDSINILSEYRKSFIQLKYSVAGKKIKNNNYIYINFIEKNNNLTTFNLVNFFDTEGNIRTTNYSNFDSLLIDSNYSRFQLNILEAYSDTIIIDNLRDTLNIFYDHIHPRIVDRYTEIDTILSIKNIVKYGKTINK